ncbi:MAG: hypothetical protein LM557_00900 [Desulfurococcaceae archaeon]|jgi:hypothetical protein|nr:hypothetical protein [Desulfurococcaceae archaeon]MCC6052861.1 hypothetical protein [Desulfurococcaceae archaeon]
MSLHETLQNLKDLVDSFEDLIEKGKIATSTRNIELLSDFISSVEGAIPQATSALERSRDVLQQAQHCDVLLKYISVYYRMLVLVSIPYTISILESASQILKTRYLEGDASKALALAEKLKNIVDTLKS